jgi:hypothetical protein
MGEKAKGYLVSRAHIPFAVSKEAAVATPAKSVCDLIIVANSSRRKVIKERMAKGEVLAYYTIGPEEAVLRNSSCHM